ncbi:MAG: GIY-YIG nuclease family protein [Bacteroidota bacterium]
MGYSLYILCSRNGDRFYIGSSDNPARRLGFHNTIEKGFTSRYRPWELVFTLEFSSKQEAQMAERKVKSWKSRSRIEKVIRGKITFK